MVHKPKHFEQLKNGTCLALAKLKEKSMKTDREMETEVLDELRWEPCVNATDIGSR